MGCTNLKSIELPDSVTQIGFSSFEGCSSLSNVTIKGAITNIEESTFYNCRNLKTVTLPYSLTRIKEKAFNLCEELTDVLCLAKTPPVIEKENCFYPGYYMAALHVPERSVEAYKAASFWSLFLNIKGDASEDGPSDNSDYMKCDTNGDGVVNIADVNRVINAILSH